MSGPGGGQFGFLFTLLPFVLIVTIFYFLLVLPQQKRAKQRKEMLDSLKKGDRIVTTGGVLGTVTNISKEVVTLQVADNVKIRILRSYVDALREDEAGKGE